MATENREAGKVDKPRNLGKKYKENYDQINWGKNDIDSKEKKSNINYK